MSPTLRERRGVYAQRVIAIVARHSPVHANPRHRLVAKAIVESDGTQMTKTLVARDSVSRKPGEASFTLRCSW